LGKEEIYVHCAVQVGYDMTKTAAADVYRQAGIYKRLFSVLSFTEQL